MLLYRNTTAFWCTFISYPAILLNSFILTSCYRGAYVLVCVCMFVCVHIYMYMRVCVCVGLMDHSWVWRSGDNFLKSILFYHVGPRDRTPDVKLCRKHLYTLGHLVSPVLLFVKGWMIVHSMNVMHLPGPDLHPWAPASLHVLATVDAAGNEGLEPPFEALQSCLVRW